ncbi:Fe-(CN)2CO cofactor assembly scaffold protein HypD [Desulfovibrionales bacterium]
MHIANVFKDPEICRGLLKQIRTRLTRPFRFMEVCGTHTVAIFQSGLNTLLPEEIVHVSGPGCPVCVTHESEVAAFLALAERPQVIIATFGDLMRVPGPNRRTLKLAQAEGAKVQVVYSPAESLSLAQANPDKQIVFLGVGFETTAPTIAATVIMAQAQGIENFRVLCCHKLVPPALTALLGDPEAAVDAFILPGHVSTIIGVEPYRFLATEHHVPAVIAGFDIVDILWALYEIIRQLAEGRAEVVNIYSRAVANGGNPRARAILYNVFQPATALWRGIGPIPSSGLDFIPAYRHFDALEALDIAMPETEPLVECRCGDILKGKMRPDLCPLFKKVCTPASPVGPCMVSAEGSCAAYFKYCLGA